MANKKNNQNKKNTEGPTMNGNSAAAAPPTVQNLVNQAAQAQANQANNNPVTTVNTTTPSSSAPPASSASSNTVNPISTSSSSSSTSAAQHQHPNHHHNHPHQTPHQRLSSSSSQGNSGKQQQQQQQQMPLKKTQQHNDVDKISNAGSQASQSSFRGGGAKDHRARDKEKENSFRSFRSGGGHHHPNNGGGGGPNVQNGQRKKDKNRDHSNQSHKSTGYGPIGGGAVNHPNPPHFALNDKTKTTGFPPLQSQQQTPAQPTAPIPPPAVPNHKTVQTDPIEEPKDERKKRVVRSVKMLPEQEEMIKKIDGKQDTVMAFKEHDEWNKVELMCELLSFLSPVDLRLVGNCIEGSVRCYTNQMRPVEKTSNCSDPTASLPPYVVAPPPAPPANSATQYSLMAQRSAMFNVFNANPIPGPPGLPGPLTKLPYPTADPPSTHSSSSALPSAKETIVTNGSAAANGNSTSLVSKEAQQERGASVTPKASTTPESDTPTPPTTSTTTTTPTTTTTGTTPISVATTNGLISTQPSPNLNPIVPAVEEPPVPQDPERFLTSVKDLTSYLYILMSVCASTNRKSAAKIADYVSKVILREKTQILTKIASPLDKIEVLQDIGKIVAAIVHHPAVSVDNKIKYNELRGSLRAEIEHLYRQHYDALRQAEPKKRNSREPTEGVGRVEESGEESEDEETEEEIMRNGMRSFYESHQSAAHHGLHPFRSSQTSSVSAAAAPPNFFITRFLGRQTEKENVFSLEIHWSDGDRTYTQRTRDQLKALQHRLLDEFGQQRSEKFHHPGMTSSMSSFDEESKKLSTSTSTMETSFALSGDRILPRLPRDATSSQIVQYINELSDLPARMMLSAVICEEFNGTRARTEDLLQESLREPADGLIFSRWKNPRSKSPLRFYSNRTNNGDIEAINLPQHLVPFLYSGVSPGHLQTLFPSCSNCGGQHEFKNCEKITLLDKKVEHKLRLEPDGSQLTTSTTSATAAITHPNAFTTSTSSGAVPLPNLLIDSNGHVVMSNPHHQHFVYHPGQSQQQQQQQPIHLVNAAGQYRQNGHYEPSPQLVMYVQQPPPPPPPSSSSQQSNPGGNGGNSSNF